MPLHAVLPAPQCTSGLGQHCCPTHPTPPRTLPPHTHHTRSPRTHPQSPPPVGAAMHSEAGRAACHVSRAGEAFSPSPPPWHPAVYSEADRAARHVSEADEAFCLGPAAARKSYLRGDRILQVPVLGWPWIFLVVEMHWHSRVPSSDAASCRCLSLAGCGRCWKCSSALFVGCGSAWALQQSCLRGHRILAAPLACLGFAVYPWFCPWARYCWLRALTRHLRCARRSYPSKDLLLWGRPSVVSHRGENPKL